jgi:N6-adenosine-specific RNA methylase IME4
VSTPTSATSSTRSSPRSRHYRVIYADPPWTFATYSQKGKGRSAEAHYNCMSLDEVKALPVADWAADDAILLLWATDPLLDRALDVIRAWASPTRRWASTG